MDKSRRCPPPFQVGEKIVWLGGLSGFGEACEPVEHGTYHGLVAWIGKIPEIGPNWIVGIEFEYKIQSGCDGAWNSRHVFTCKPGHGLFLPSTELIRHNEFYSNAQTTSDSKRGGTSCNSEISKGNVLNYDNLQGGVTGLNEDPSSPQLGQARRFAESKPAVVIRKRQTGKGQNKSSVTNKQDLTLDKFPVNDNLRNSGKPNGTVLTKSQTFQVEERIVENASAINPNKLTLQNQPNINYNNAKLLRREKTSSGFLNIFKWFRPKDSSSRNSIGKFSKMGGGSSNSISSATSSFAYFPVVRSKSAGSSKELKDKCEGESDNKFGMYRRYDVLSYDSSIGSNQSSNRRLSAKSGSVQSDRSTGKKKRPAPQPPGSPKSGETGLHNSETSFSSLPLNDGTLVNTNGRKLQKSNSEGVIYARWKRKAPVPPKDSSLTDLTIGGKSRGNDTLLKTNSNASSRPHSNTSAIGSPASNVSTMKSTTSSGNSNGSVSSFPSAFGESSATNFCFQEANIVKCTSTPTVSNELNSPMPRPWYKRQKNKSSKEPTPKVVDKKRDTIYDLWMPEIQFSRKRLSFGGFRKNSEGKFDHKDENRKSQVSLLANISELDRAAAEQMQKAQEERRLAKEAYNDKFYKNKSPLMLSQEDILPNKSVNSPVAPIKSISQTELNKTSTTSALQSTIVTEDIEISYAPSAPDADLIDNSQNDDNLDSLQNPDLTFHQEINSRDVKPSLNKTVATPIQKAVFDAELFYKLAKDSQQSQNSKMKQSMCNKGKMFSDNEPNEQHASENDSPMINRRLKNFGIRMNQMFSPDVSTIMETSESVTSSANTPAEGDFPSPTCYGSRDINPYQDFSVRSATTFEFRLDTEEAREIMKEIADVRQEIDRINAQEKHDSMLRKERKKAELEKEFLMLKQRNNFSVWHNMCNSNNTLIEQSKPIETGKFEEAERKLKWVCNVCTLINLPWRLQCEACQAIRPSKPKRVDVDGNLLSVPQTSESVPSGSDGSPVTVIQRDEDADSIPNTSDCAGIETIDAISRKCSSNVTVTQESKDNKKNSINWEKELQKYFHGFEDNFQNMSFAGDRLSASFGLIKKIKEENPYGKIMQKNIFTKEENISQENCESNLSNEKKSLKKKKRRKKIEINGNDTLAEIKPRPGSSDVKINSDDIFKNNDEQKSFYKKALKKHRAIERFGAVKSAVSIFNRLDQTTSVADRPVPNKPRRLSSTNIAEQAQLFDSMSSEPNVITNVMKEKPIRGEINIGSTISKFDEMAAIAEIERLNPSSPNKFKGNLPKRKLIHPNIKDGVLYTTGNSRMRSTSIGSGTFELLEAKDFENIEAAHSRRPSPTPEFEITPVNRIANIPEIRLEEIPSDNKELNIQNNSKSIETQDVDLLSKQLTEANGIANFKATLKIDEQQLGQMNTMNINRILRRLENAISIGNHQEAASLAHSLAEMRLSCSVVRNRSEPVTSNFNQNDIKNDNIKEGGKKNDASHPGSSTQVEIQETGPTESAISGAIKRNNRVDNIRREVKSDNVSRLLDEQPEESSGTTEEIFDLMMYVEDKTTHQGPISVTVTSSMTVEHLKIKVSEDFGFPVEVQRWILGRRLADDDSQNLSSYKVTQGCPIFLYLVAPEGFLGYQEDAEGQNYYGTFNGSQISSGKSERSDEYSDVSQNFDETVIENQEVGRSRSDLQSSEVGRSRSDLQSSDENIYHSGSEKSRKDSVSGRRLQNQSSFGDSSPEILSGQNMIFYDALSDQDYQLEQFIKNNKHAPQIINHKPEVSQIINMETVQTNIEDSKKAENSKTYNVASQNKSGLYPNLENINYSNDNPSNATQVPQPTKKLNTVVMKPMLPNISSTNVHYEPKVPGNQLNQEKGGPIVLVNKVTKKNVTVNVTDESGQIYHKVRVDLKDIKNDPNVSQIKNKQNIQKVIIGNSPMPMTQIENTNNPIGITANPDITNLKIIENENVKNNTPTSVVAVNNINISNAQSNTNNVSIGTNDTFTQNLPTNIKNDTDQIKSDNILHNPANTQPIINSTRQEIQLINDKQPYTPDEKLNITTSKTLIHNSNLQQAPKITSPLPTKIINNMQNITNAYSTSAQNPVSALIATNSPSLATNNVKIEEKKASNGQIDKGSIITEVPLKLNEVSVTAEHSNSTIQVGVIPGWVCPRCTLVNPWERPGCEACTTDRPTQANQSGTSAPVPVSSNKIVNSSRTALGRAVSALDTQGTVPNQNCFECPICFLLVFQRKGVVLRDCLHNFCRECLKNAIIYSETADVKCPYRDDKYACDSSLQEREIKDLVSKREYEKHLNKSVKQAAGAMSNIFHCKTPDCQGFCQFEDNVNIFQCSVCLKVNCLTCHAIHSGKTCKQYQEEISKKEDEATSKTKKFFDEMIERGDGMPCPQCSVMLVRKWGCDWMRCPMCRTEICWVTRGPRWGPGGNGDTSAGCKCGVNGKKCHPKCTYCH